MAATFRGSMVGLLGSFLAVCTLTLASCSITHAHGVEALPDETVEDWVTYGDYLLPFTATSVRRQPRTEKEIQRGEGIDIRLVTVALNQPLWKGAGARTPAPTTLELGSGGWTFSSDKRETELRFDGQVDLSFGQDYLGVFTFTNLTDPSSPGEWVELAMFPLTDGVVGEQRSNDEANEPARRRVQGLTIAEVSEVLTSTKPDPRALPFMKLDPTERYAEANS